MYRMCYLFFCLLIAYMVTFSVKAGLIGEELEFFVMFIPFFLVVFAGNAWYSDVYSGEKV